MPIDGIFMSIMDDFEDGIYILDPERRITHWNRAAERITGYRAEDIVGRLCQDNLLCHIDMKGNLLCLTGCPMYDTLCDGARRSAEVLLRHREGHRVAVKVKSVPVIEDGAVVAAIEIFTQQGCITEGYGELLEVMSEKMVTDMLTGLSNRSHTQSYLEHKLKEFQRFHRLFCVLYIDIDNFSDFNNTYGHSAADKLLIAIASGFKHNLRGSDIIGRWGGEEFIGVFSIADAKETLAVAEKILALVANSEIFLGGQRVGVTCSMGAAIVREGDTLESIVERADAYMYRSKKHGKNRVSVEGIHCDDTGG